ncbi:MAG: hypothetical protein JWM76_1238 [Pseudonocardiales bacterium]|nr:hypothetical protein [Pseudonocardiales bacterium]
MSAGTFVYVLRYLHPRWIALHVFVLASCFGMYYAGGWQWQVAQRHHGDIRNYAYSLQWYAFVAFALWFWVKVMRDTWTRQNAPSRQNATTGGAPGPVSAPVPSQLTSAPTYRGYVMPQAEAITVEDPELARYNAYLNALGAVSPVSPVPAALDSPAAGTARVRSEGRP